MHRYFVPSMWCKVKRVFHRSRKFLGFLFLHERFVKEFLKSQPTNKELDEIYKERLEKNKHLRPRIDFSLDELRQIDEIATKERERQQVMARKSRDYILIQNEVKPIIDECVKKIDKIVSETCGEDWQNIRSKIGELRANELIYGDESYWMFEDIISSDPERTSETIEEILIKTDSDPNKDVVILRNFIVHSFIDKIEMVFSELPKEKPEDKIWTAEDREVQKIIPSKELQEAVASNNSLLSWLPQSLKKLILEGKPIPADILNRGIEREVKTRISENSEYQRVNRLENRQ